MATRTRVLATFDSDNVQFQFDYDDVNRVVAFRCVNNSGQAAYGELVRKSDGLALGHRFGPGTTFIAVPTSPAALRRIVTNPEGKYMAGVEFRFLWPYP